MKLLNYISFLTVFSSAILSGCQGAISSSETPPTNNSVGSDDRELNLISEIPQVESSIRLDNPKLNMPYTIKCMGLDLMIKQDIYYFRKKHLSIKNSNRKNANDYSKISS